jgi:hypothetical protein
VTDIAFELFSQVEEWLISDRGKLHVIGQDHIRFGKAVLHALPVLGAVAAGVPFVILVEVLPAVLIDRTNAVPANFPGRVDAEQEEVLRALRAIKIIDGRLFEIIDGVVAV